jgi:virginiamycin B lyase
LLGYGFFGGLGGLASILSNRNWFDLGSVTYCWTVWFLQFRTDRIGRFQAGRFTEGGTRRSSRSASPALRPPNGAVSFGMLRKGGLGRLRDGRLDEFELPRGARRPYSVAVDAAGNVWYADISGSVGMLPEAEAAR